MKKIIALLLCISNCAWGLNYDLGTMSHWNGLSFKSQVLIATASVLSTIGLLYAAWPISEESALKKAKDEFSARAEAISRATIATKPTPTPRQIKKAFDESKCGNPIPFPFGPFWNRNAYHVLVGALDCEETETKDGMCITKSCKTVSTLQIIKKRPLKKFTLHYHADLDNENKWVHVLSSNEEDNLDIKLD